MLLSLRTARRALLSVISVGLATVVTLALFAAVPSSAQQGSGCGDGFVPSDDGTSCVSEADGAFNDNVTTTTSCVQGVLSEDGTQCLVPRLDAAPAPVAAANSNSQTVAGPAQAFTG